MISGTAAAPARLRVTRRGIQIVLGLLWLLDGLLQFQPAMVVPRCDGAAAAERPPRWTAAAWATLWLGGVVLQLFPGRDTNASIGMSLAMNASGAPSWFASIDAHLAALVPGSGVSIVADLIVLQAFAAIGALRAPACGWRPSSWAPGCRWPTGWPARAWASPGPAWPPTRARRP